MIRRFAALAAAGTALTLSLSGCFGEGNPTSGGNTSGGSAIQLTAAQALAQTSEKTGQVESFKASVSMQSGGGTDGSLDATGTMLYQLTPTQAFSMSFDKMTVGGMSMGGMQQVFVDRTFYLKVPMLAQLGGGSSKPWLRISLDDLGQQTGMNFDQLLQQAQQFDPVQTTKLMTASKDVREVGTQTVDGVQTTHFTGTYNITEAVAKLTPEQRAAMEQAARDAGMQNMMFDLWVDDQQLPRKMTIRTAQGATVPLTMTVVYRDFGEPVSISAPPASQVSDFRELVQSMPDQATN